MVIGLQDRSLEVTYIQLILKEYFGINLRKSIKKYTRSAKERYEISQNTEVKVTGIYTADTYTAIALYMMFNYPNEQFPERWDLKGSSTTKWYKTPFNKSKLILTMNYLIESKLVNKIGDEITEEKYNKFVKDQETYFTYDELTKYFESELSLYDTLYDKEHYAEDKSFTEEDVNSCIIVFLSHNLEVLPFQSRVVEINERILSYFLDEVVTPTSDPDEIMRVQKIMYPQGLNYKKVGRFFEEEVDEDTGEIVRNSMEQDIRNLQQLLVERYSVSGEFLPPEGFSGYKVTGYFDPWTEWVAKGGLD